MTRAQLVDRMIQALPHLSVQLTEQAVKRMFESMAEALEAGKRIEIRGFGSFALRYRAPRHARNPKTGEQVETSEKYVPSFKAGKELRERVNQDV